MSAQIIILPTVTIGASPSEDVVTTPPLRLPRRVHGRLLKLASEWDVAPGAAAEMLLLRAINTASGLRNKG